MHESPSVGCSYYLDAIGYTINILLAQRHDSIHKHYKIIDVMLNDFTNPVKVDFPVFMYSKITKADHLLEPLRQFVK